jgi:hypothetical protein
MIDVTNKEWEVRALCGTGGAEEKGNLPREQETTVSKKLVFARLHKAQNSANHRKLQFPQKITAQSSRPQFQSFRSRRLHIVPIIPIVPILLFLYENA